MGEEEEEEEEGDIMDYGTSLQSPVNGNKKGGNQKKPETEEEKRRNFLERNRQAALKCRQRKKAWLAQLQAKVEYLTNENERLTSALVTAREEISRLSSLVGGVGVSANPHNGSHHQHAVTVTSGPGSGVVNGVGMNGVGMNGGGIHGHHGPASGGNAPISVNVSVPPNGKNGVAMVGGGARGYGY